MAVEPKLAKMVDELWQRNQNFFTQFINWSKITNEEKIEILRLWNKHSDLLGVCIKALYHCTVKKVDKIKELYELVFPDKRDYTKYYVGKIEDWNSFLKGGKIDFYDKNGLIFNIIERYCKARDYNITDVQNAFPQSIRKITNAPIVKVVGKDEESGRYKQIKDYNIFVHQSAWDGTTLMRHFIRHTKKVFPEMTEPIIEIPHFIYKAIVNKHKQKKSSF